MAGARPEHTGYLLDGTNIADISDKAPAGLSGGLLGVDTVREFSVQTHGYSAEFGRAAGGIVSAVTRSGTNDVRGSLLRVPPRQRARRARTTSIPTIRPASCATSSAARSADRSAGTRSSSSPATRACRIAAPSRASRGCRMPPRTPASCRTARAARRRSTVNPGARPYLDLLFPIPDGRSFGDGTAEMSHGHRDPLEEHAYVGKLDWLAGRVRHADAALLGAPVGGDDEPRAPAVPRRDQHPHRLPHRRSTSACSGRAA